MICIFLTLIAPETSGRHQPTPTNQPTNRHPTPQNAYKLVTEGKFADGLKAFQSMLRAIPLLVVESRREVDEAKELVGICKEYVIGLLCEIKRKELREDEGGAARAAELAAYFTHCALQPVHLALSLRSAMAIFFKLRNFATAATFARRLLELNPGAKMAQAARQVLTACEKTPVDEVPVNYDPRNPFDICTLTFTPIYRGSKFVEDRYTAARFHPGCEGRVSPVGEFCKVGADAGGLTISPTQLAR